jgi:hypothetical protein
MPHLPPAHHETSKRDSPNETKIKEKQNKTIPDLNLNFAKSMTHHNQTKKLITWFLRFHRQFDCQSFVSVSLRPNMMQILRQILQEVSDINSTGETQPQLVRKIREFLKDKRYVLLYLYPTFLFVFPSKVLPAKL